MNINNLIRKRRTIYPKQYNGGKISKVIIKNILKNAHTAPTHKLTQPWIFKVFDNTSKEELAKEIIRIQLEKNLQKKNILEKFELSSHIICICMKRDDKKRVPEWEEIASTAMAVQNMWMTCTANKIGCYWSTPKAMIFLNNFLRLSKNERCLGFFYMGTYDKLPERNKTRNSINMHVEWM